MLFINPMETQQSVPIMMVTCNWNYISCSQLVYSCINTELDAFQT